MQNSDIKKIYIGKEYLCPDLLNECLYISLVLFLELFETPN